MVHTEAVAGVGGSDIERLASPAMMDGLNFLLLALDMLLLTAIVWTIILTGMV